MDVQYLKLVHIDLVNERYQEVHLMHARMLLSIRTKVGIVVEMVVAVVAVAVVVAVLKKTTTIHLNQIHPEECCKIHSVEILI